MVVLRIAVREAVNWLAVGLGGVEMPRRADVDPRFAVRLRELRSIRGLSLQALARAAFVSKSHICEIENRIKTPGPEIAKALDDALQADGELAGMVSEPGGQSRSRAPSTELTSDEMEALELSRRVEASDMGAGTLDRLERAVDDLATAYAATPPAELLPRVRQHLGYVGGLVGARATLGQQRRLLVAGGWLSLLAATLSIDLRERPAAAARLATAAQMAEHAGHAEIQAWCLETRAWDVLTDGDHPTAVKLSRQAQSVAPRGSSAYIQATAQEARAWARMDMAEQTRDALERMSRLTSSLAVPDRPEHHYQYDPDKALSYTATTLAWVGDPAAEEFARDVIGQLERPTNGTPRPRRIASARLDLALALLRAGKPDEAHATAITAIMSGRVVASNWWRVTEVLVGVERAGIPEAAELREVYEAHRPQAGSSPMGSAAAT